MGEPLLWRQRILSEDVQAHLFPKLHHFTISPIGFSPILMKIFHDFPIYPTTICQANLHFRWLKSMAPLCQEVLRAMKGVNREENSEAGRM
jgi:hypothetical protein